MPRTAPRIPWSEHPLESHLSRVGYCTGAAWGTAVLTAAPSPIPGGVASNDLGLVPVRSPPFLAWRWVSWSPPEGLEGLGLPPGSSHSALALIATPAAGGRCAWELLWSSNGGRSLSCSHLSCRLSLPARLLPTPGRVPAALTCRTGESGSCLGLP